MRRGPLIFAVVVLATLAGSTAALATFSLERRLDVGTVRLSVEPGHKGALDLYVPLVDWGVRFDEAITLPVRLHVDLRTVDRNTVYRVAEGQSFNVQSVRDEARDAIAAYLRTLIL